MTLIAATLDAALSLSNLRKVMAAFLTTLFEEQVDGLEYLQHELPQHIQGWLSSACVRSITGRAHDEWRFLADRNFHPPGLIPNDDSGEITRLLTWIAGTGPQGRETRFETSSSDVLAIAMVLNTIGLDLLKVGGGSDDLDENHIVVKLRIGDFFTQPKVPSFAIHQRWGMRIPLTAMQECVSLWPAADNNELRRLFEDGMHAAGSVRIIPGVVHEKSIIADIRSHCGLGTFYYSVIAETHKTPRLDGDVWRFVSNLFPVVTPGVERGIEAIMRSRPGWKLCDEYGIIEYAEEDRECRAELQAFVMGFYYALLLPLLDTTQLSTQEAFGSWGWYDVNLLHKISGYLAGSRIGKIGGKTAYKKEFRKEGIFQLLAVFFAGADEKQVALVVEGVTGVIGKLSILTASLLGNVDNWQKAGKYFLLDIDPSCIPCSTRGIVASSRQRDGIMVIHQPEDSRLGRIELIGPHKNESDFTSHIEPDWEFDIQTCIIVFRYLGRYVRRISPIDLELAVVRDSDYHMLSMDQEPVPYTIEEVLVANLDDFSNAIQASNTASSSSTAPPVLVLTQGSQKARSALRAMYMMKEYKRLPPNHTIPSLQPLTQDSSAHAVDGPILLYRSGGDEGEDPARYPVERLVILT